MGGVWASLKSYLGNIKRTYYKFRRYKDRIYTKTEKKELDKVRGVFAEHLRQCPDFELLWSDKVGYVWLAIGLEPL